MTISAHLTAQWHAACERKPALKVHNDDFTRACQQFRPHGHLPQWLQTVAALPAPPAESHIDLNAERISARNAGQLTLDPAPFQSLMPWRKGLFHFHGVDITSEWRSDWKFARLQAAGIDWRHKHVLDVGTGNGYFLWRMAGAGAALALGLDPSSLYFAQFLAGQKYLAAPQTALLPLTLDELPLTGFDITLSMGVLYHRRDPLQHLSQLRATLRAGGLLLLETLIVSGDEQTVFTPRDRYAGMKNVWFIPSLPALCRWLERLGFSIEYQSPPVATTALEQRTTAWQTGKSLADFMQPDFAATCEGLPPPQRAIVLARKKA